jgi:hypothetical protein
MQHASWKMVSGRLISTLFGHSGQIAMESIAGEDLRSIQHGPTRCEGRMESGGLPVDNTHLRAGRSYYSSGLGRAPMTISTPGRKWGGTDDLGSCQSYSPGGCPTACPICLGGCAL